MEKISPEAKKKYAEKIKEYRQSIEEIQKAQATLEGTIRKSPQGAGYKRLELAEAHLNLVSYYILMNSLSLSLLGIKNENYLNEARKCCYKSIICLEEIVSPYVDVPFSEYEEGLGSISELTDEQKYHLIRKLGFAIDAVLEGFGDNSKWKWSFVELESRYATITKNLVNMKTIIAQLDPRIAGYSERLNHLNLSKRLLQQAADRYREKYELSTQRLDDIKQAIYYLAALKRFHMLLGEIERAEVVKKKIDLWRAKMESDQKKLEEADKQKSKSSLR